MAVLKTEIKVAPRRSTVHDVINYICAPGKVARGNVIAKILSQKFIVFSDCSAIYLQTGPAVYFWIDDIVSLDQYSYGQGVYVSIEQS